MLPTNAIVDSLALLQFGLSPYKSLQLAVIFAFSERQASQENSAADIYVGSPLFIPRLPNLRWKEIPSDINQHPIFRKPRTFGVSRAKSTSQYCTNGRIYLEVRSGEAAIWLFSRMAANEHRAMSDGNIIHGVEVIFAAPFTTSHRPYSTFTADEIIPLSLRGPSITTSNHKTSVDVRHSPDTSDGTTDPNDLSLNPSTPIPARTENRKRPWRIERILRRRKAPGPRRRGRQCLVEWTPGWLTLAEADIVEKR